ncbi:MAG: phosphate acyltransferase PlsX [Gammaproteobacteria bacterium]|nr:phosphate acyltransferase PlsX [Gammaproteobacteria bacterium]
MPAHDRSISIAIDAMSGDHGPSVIVPAALDALNEYPRLSIQLVGDERALRAVLDDAGSALRERIEIKAASEVVAMDESPRHALRSKRDSSMRVAIRQVKTGAAQACVSAGNTGALMATAHFVLKMLPGIDRPAICSAIPTVTGHVYMLDLGANADCTPEHLLEFAVMGSALVSAVDGTAEPRIGLLNIGEEEIKGNGRVKHAAQMLSASGLNYTGYIEGNDITSGKVDVIVSDGFAGNVAIKSIEGTASFIALMLREEFRRHPIAKLAGLMAWPVLRRLSRRLNPGSYNGASFLGLRGIVVKSHGSADRLGFKTAIRAAILEVDQNVPERISHMLAETHTPELEA